ncbi:hypothetical protein P4573_28730 [Priestia megaterium]|uniref:hypothetical protein n=1 Tax=Bacteria TaxID=2 RepID=UPI00263B8329|nr:hypothetical protein [Priestia megaterium]MDN4866234.1 hypothetical protein [Priestia megaterium]MED3816185.1 hypothetical protein [Priestia megaterium]
MSEYYEKKYIKGSNSEEWHDCKENEVRKSAFRAVNTTNNQNVPEDTRVKVRFPNEQFDLANEYNPGSSTFIPKKDGVYSIIASVQFDPNHFNNPYRVLLIIQVNGKDVARDNDFFSTIQFDNDVAVSTIIELNAGDIVEVFVVSSVAGEIVADSATTRFEAVRDVKL